MYGQQEQGGDGVSKKNTQISLSVKGKSCRSGAHKRYLAIESIMSKSLNNQSCRIARRADNQGARPVNVPQVAVEKSDSEDVESPPSTTTKENYKNTRLFKGKKNVIVSSFNVRTLRDTQIHELVASAEMYNNDIICVQEHRFVHEDILIKEHDVGKRMETYNIISLEKQHKCFHWRNSNAIESRCLQSNELNRKSFSKNTSSNFQWKSSSNSY